MKNRILIIISVTTLVLISIASIIGIYLYDDSQREKEYQIKYEAAMKSYDNQLTQFNQCNMNLSKLDLPTNSPKYIVAQVQCMNLKPKMPIVFKRSRIFNLPFLN